MISDLRAVDDELVFPHKPKEVCKEKSSKISDMNFLNRALNHTKVSCTWDEPETDNRRCAILFQDGIENKVDLDEYLAPEVESRSSTSEEAEKESMAEEDLAEEETESEAPENIYSDFDKKNRKRGGMKVTFKNPFESKGVELQDDNLLGKRVYSMKKAKKFDEEEPQENDDTFFQGFPEEEDEELAEFARGKGADDKMNKKDKFKERMKEKKRQAKLDKESQRLEKLKEKEGRRQASDKKAEELALLVDEEDGEEFVSAFVDPRFERFKKDPNMKIDPTSNLFKKAKHLDLQKKIKL